MAELSAQKAKTLFDYNPENGVVTRKITTSPNAKKGDVCGALMSDGQRMKVSVEGRQYYLHRVIWLIMTGEMPDVIDHIDGNGLNNKWENLRNVDRRGNTLNRKLYKNSTSGVVGVNWNNLANNWRARISDHGKVINLGSFDDFFESCCARKGAENRYGYHVNHGRRV